VKVSKCSREIGECETKLERLRGAYSNGSIELAEFVGSWSAEAAAAEKARVRRDQLTAALRTVSAAIKAAVAETLDSLGALRTGVRESARLADRTPDPLVVRLELELQAVDRDLLALEGEPGQIADALTAQKSDISARILERKREVAAEAANRQEDLVERCALGEPTALVELVAIVRARPMAFAPQLADQIIDAMGDALSSASELAEFLD